MKKIDLVVISSWIFSGALVLGGCAGVEAMDENDEDATEVARPSDETAESEETGSATSAINGNLTLVSQVTNRCLDSNGAGSVYTLPCNGGNWQNWFVVAGGAAGTNRLVNQATGRCLDSNGAGSVYTLPCNGGNWQNWGISGDYYKTLLNAATWRVLDSSAGNVYTNPSNQTDFQHWY